jgi:hypothetical protein
VCVCVFQPRGEIRPTISKLLFLADSITPNFLHWTDLSLSISLSCYCYVAVIQVCAFRLPQDYKRNDAILPCGDMWLSFPVWTEQGLKDGLAEKKRIMGQIQANLVKRDEELEKYDQTQNPIQKAFFLRNAFAFAEKCNSLHHFLLDTIPEENQTFELQENLLLATNGLVWKRNGNGHVLLGSAIVSQPVPSREKN